MPVRADWIDNFVKDTMTKRKIPGLSLAVIKDGKLVRAKGYGFANLELQVPATKDTVYEIGSISKQMASEAVMLLVEDGKLRLDDSINKYLPANAPQIWQKITVRDLLNHTSGLKDWTEIKAFSYRREYTAEEFIELVKPFPLLFEPKNDWRYSNTNLPLIGVVVEKASGKPFEEFVTERIIKPLNLATIRFKHQEDVVPDRATGYVLQNDVWKNGEPFRPRIIAPSGGILASAVDLARWWEAVLQGRVVKQASLTEMIKPAKLNDGRSVSHGFAFFTNTFNGNKSIFHAGSTVGGFGSMVYYFPKDKLTVAVIGNLEDGGFGAEYIAKRVFNFYIPGSYVGGLKEVVDVNKTKNALEILKEIADGKVPESLSASFASRMPDAFRKQLGENLKQMKSFAYIGNEKIGENHFMLEVAAAEFFRYKMKLVNKTVYYHFRMNKDGKIGWIIFEE
ncbi:MAG: serine hydrolase domain-containing protein [Pyrinomonadaceae bacterium]